MTTAAIDDEKTLDRIVFFSDAVFAIAMTLLVLDLRPPVVPSGLDRALWHQLSDQLPSFWSFALSFFVIGVMWMAHLRKFRLIRRYDDRLLWLNIVFLFCIAFLPFPTAVLGGNGGRAATIFYASSMAVTGIASFLLTFYAFGKHRLIDPDVDPRLVTHWARRAATVPVMFAASIPIAFASPKAAQLVWPFVFVATFVLERIHRRRTARTGDGGTDQSRVPTGQ